MSTKPCPKCAICGGMDPEHRAWDYGGKNYCGPCYINLEDEGAVMGAECNSCSAVMWVGTITCPMAHKETKEKMTLCIHCWWDDNKYYTKNGWELKTEEDSE